MKRDKIVCQLLISAAVLGTLTLVGNQQASAAMSSEYAANLNAKVTDTNVNASEVKLETNFSTSTTEKNESISSEQSDELVVDNINQSANVTSIDKVSDSSNVTKDAVTVTNLGSASSEQIDQAKAKAQQVYQTTGKAQTITAVSDLTAPTETETQLPKGVTASAVIHYVNYLTNDSMTIPNGYAVGLPVTGEVSGSYTYNSKLPKSIIDAGKSTIKAEYISPRIAHYGIVGYLDANGQFTQTPPTQGNNLIYGKQVDLTTYYAPLSDMEIEYVDEADPSHILYVYTIPVGNAENYNNDVAGNDTYNVSYYTPDIYGYEYDAEKTDQSKLKGQLTQTQTATDSDPMVITFMYRRTDQPISQYASQYPIIVNPDKGPWRGSADIATTEQNISVPKGVDINQTKVQDYDGFTLLAVNYGLSDTGEPVLIGPVTTAYAEDKPTNVQYVDETTGKVIMVNGASSTEVLSGSKEMGWTWTAEQKTFDGYTFDQVVGPTSGKFDAIERVITFLYKPINTDNGGKSPAGDGYVNNQPSQPIDTISDEPSAPVDENNNITDTDENMVPTSPTKTTDGTVDSETVEKGTAVSRTGATNPTNAQAVKKSTDTTGAKPVLNTAETTETLPQTNESQSSVWGLLGAFMLSVLGLLGFDKKKRHNS